MFVVVSLAATSLASNMLGSQKQLPLPSQQLGKVTHHTQAACHMLGCNPSAASYVDHQSVVVVDAAHSWVAAEFA